MEEAYTQCISVCPNCGFIFTKNPFSSEQLNNRYKMYSKYEFDDKDYFLEEADSYRLRSQRQKNFIKRVIGDVRSILEVGAASGYNLSLYKECDVFGVEPSAINCINAKRKYGIEMFCGVFDEFYAKKADDLKYDIVFLSHVLEHIINPVDFVKKCAEMNNRFLFIEVPTFDYKFINEPYGMFCEEHVNMFTLESLENLMKKCGYALLNADIILGIEQNLPAGFSARLTIWEKREVISTHRMVQNSEVNLENYIAQSQKEMLRINSIIDEISDNVKLAIWGTGHHASMLLANTNLDKKILLEYMIQIRKSKGLILRG